MSMKDRQYLIHAGDTDYEVSSKELRYLVSKLDLDDDIEDDAQDTITGLNCDTYSDLGTDRAKQFETVDDLIVALDEDRTLRLCETWHRILNLNNDDETVYNDWKDCNVATLEWHLTEE